MAGSRLIPRSYELEIAEVASSANTLVVLPTGRGKTAIAFQVARARLARFPKGKVVMVAPTKPLALQHSSTFGGWGKVKDGETYVATGEADPSQRSRLWRRATYVFGTPQAILNDVKSGRISLFDVVLLVFDEAHRSVRNYDYTKLARAYVSQAQQPRTMGLTASPGGSRTRFEEVKKRLYIERIEARTEDDPALGPYVQPVKVEKVRVPLPPEYRSAIMSLRVIVDEKVSRLAEAEFFERGAFPNKAKLLRSRGRLAFLRRTKREDRVKVAALLEDQSQAVVVSHALELLETQGGPVLRGFIQSQKAKMSPSLLALERDRRWASVEVAAETLAGIPYPKLEKLVDVVTAQLSSEPSSKVIVFCLYRGTIGMIIDRLKAAGVAASRLVGQSKKEGKGMNQAQQVETLEKFQKGEFRVLVSSSVGEEGLHLPDVDLVVFYEALPSDVRSVQRRGRTGRSRPGKVVILLAEGTVDEANLRTSLSKERSMRDLVTAETADKRSELLERS